MNRTLSSLFSLNPNSTHTPTTHHHSNTGDIVITRSFKILVDTWKAQLDTWRSNHVDTGAQSRAKTNRLTSAEEKRETDARRSMPSGVISDRIIMRSGFMSIVGAPTLLRGIQLRHLRDAKLIIHELKNVGPAPCTPLAMSVTNTKTSRSSAHIENFVGIVRSHDRTACAINYLASYKAYLHDVRISEG